MAAIGSQTSKFNMVYPVRNLPAGAQAWGAAIEKEIQEAKAMASGASGAAGKVSARFSSYMGAVSDLQRILSEVSIESGASLAQAKSAVTWSEVDPVSPAEDGSVASPDIPDHNDATWFVFEWARLSGDRQERQVKKVWRWKPPTFEPGDQVGEWVQEKYGTATLGEGAVTLKNLEGALSEDMATARKAVDLLQATEQRLTQAAEDAKKLAQEALDKANNAAPGGSADGRVIVSPEEPQGADRKAGNLWINTRDGGARPYAYNAPTDTWIEVKSKEAAQAAQTAVEMQKKANEALEKAQAAQDAATAAQLAADKAQQSADGKGRIFYTPQKPDLGGRKEGDLWYDTSDGYRPYIYSEKSKDFVPLNPGQVDLSNLENRIQAAENKASQALEGNVKALADKLQGLGGTLIPGPYPPDEGDVGDFWLGPDGVLYRKTKVK